MGTLSKGLKEARELGNDDSSVNPEFVSENGYDLCVYCKDKTPYKTEDDIGLRLWYIEGAGQLCEKCHKEIYG